MKGIIINTRTALRAPRPAPVCLRVSAGPRAEAGDEPRGLPGSQRGISQWDQPAGSSAACKSRQIAASNTPFFSEFYFYF